MDSSLAIKPAQNASAAPSARSKSSQATVATDLGAGKAVAAAARTELSPPLARRPEALIRDVIADPQSREVVFRALEPSARRLARPKPEEALRRRHAYDRALAKGAAKRQARRQTDLKA